MTSKVPHKPEGYQSVIPYIHANGAAKLIAFMKEVFDASEIAVYPRPDGTIGHAAMRIGDSVVELAMAARTGRPCPAPCRSTTNPLVADHLLPVGRTGRGDADISERKFLSIGIPA
jgi:hypothetical protein